MNEKTIARFWSKVEKTDGCWFWIGCHNAGGYGYFKLHGRQGYAHRASWEIHFSPIPTGIQVLHRCDTPSCVNPEHLFLGSQIDNMADMLAKGRKGNRVLVRGERHGQSKLTADAVRTIRAAPDTDVCLAKRFGVCNQLISQIRTRKIWKHIA